MISRLTLIAQLNQLSVIYDDSDTLRLTADNHTILITQALLTTTFTDAEKVDILNKFYLNYYSTYQTIEIILKNLRGL